MSFRFGYFDSDIVGVDDEGMPIFDRAETSDLFALLFASLVSDGVLALPATCLQVKAVGAGLNISIEPGFGMVKGHFCYNEEIKYLSIETAPQKYSRIDRVIMRCNYLDRMVEIVIKTGVEAANPTAPPLLRPAAGDYYELCLANIRLSPKQKIITQSNITDTRPNSAVCGYITQLIDHLDTAVFFDQFEQFYKEFVDKSNLSFEQFMQMTKDYYDELTERGEEKYNLFNTNIITYIDSLKDKGNSDLAILTQQLLDFRNLHEAAFLEWFDKIKGQLGTDAAGNLQNEIDRLTIRINDLSEMLYTGMVATNLKTSDNDVILDDTGANILIDWPICCCNVTCKCK